MDGAARVYVTCAGASSRAAQDSKTSFHGQDADIDTQIFRAVIRTSAPIRRSRSRIVSACAFAMLEQAVQIEPVTYDVIARKAPRPKP